MYISSTGSSGVMQLIKEVVDNSFDEYLAGHANKIVIVVRPKDNFVSVTDNGRGIPVEEHRKTHQSTLTTAFTKLHAGGKFDKGTYKVSGGLHGVGVSVVNALSEQLTVEVYRDGNIYSQSYQRGIPTGKLTVTGKTRKRWI